MKSLTGALRALGLAALCALSTLFTLSAQAQTLAVAFPRTYSAMETDKLYRGYLEHLGRCTGASLTNHFSQPLAGRLFAAETVAESQMPDLLKSGRLQLALVTSATAVQLQAQGIAQPVALRGQHASRQAETFELQLLVRADAPATGVAQLAGARIGFPAASTDAGAPPLDERLAVKALADAGLAGQYAAHHAAGHERALMGLAGGFWQAAFVASDQFDRMVKKREVRAGDFRVLWRSRPLPTESLVVAAGLPTAVRERITQCSHSYRFNAEQARLFEGSDAWLAPDEALYGTYRALLR